MAHVTDDVRAVYELPLTDSGSPDVPGGYIYLPPPSDPAYCVRFTIDGTSSICRQGSLWVNIPEQGEGFDRHTFREYKSVNSQWLMMQY
jgi:glycogen debranching enzyme